MVKLFAFLVRLWPKKKKKAGKEEALKVPGLKMALVGLPGAGKTTLMAALGEDCRNSRDLKIEYTDSKTADYFLSSIRKMSGTTVGAGSDAGTDPNRRRFPDRTEEIAVFTFKIHIENSETLISGIDYPGSEIVIGRESENRDKMVDFFSRSNTILYVMDSCNIKDNSIIDEYQAIHSNIFASLKKHKVKFHPSVALVLTKADQLEGYSSELPTTLFRHIDNANRFADYNSFIDVVLDKRRARYSSSVMEFYRSILLQLRPLIEVIHKNTLELNIFFVSSIGGNPEKVIGEDGSDVDIPPEDIHPQGIRDLITWTTGKLRRYRRLYRWKLTLRMITLVCLWFSIAYLGLELFHRYYYASNFITEYSGGGRGHEDRAKRSYQGSSMSFTKNVTMSRFLYTAEIRQLVWGLTTTPVTEKPKPTTGSAAAADEGDDEKAQAGKDARAKSSEIQEKIATARRDLMDIRRRPGDPSQIHESLKALAKEAHDYYKNTYQLSSIRNFANQIDDYLEKYDRFASQSFMVNVSIAAANADEIGGANMQVIRVYVGVNGDLKGVLDKMLPVTHANIAWKPADKVTFDVWMKGESKDRWDIKSPYFPDISGSEHTFAQAGNLRTRITLKFDTTPDIPEL